MAKTVEILVGLSGYFGGGYRSLSNGDTIELPDAEADRLIAVNYARLPVTQSQSNIPVDADGYAISQYHNLIL